METTDTEGQCLGGGDTGRPLTASEIRERRLAALAGGGTPAASIPPPPSTTVDEVGVDEEDFEDDEDMQKALSMSLQKDGDDEQGIKKLSAASMPSTTSEFLDIAEFHSTMWDSRVTTNNDKDRWVGQGVDVRQDAPIADDDRNQQIAPTALQFSRLDLVGSNHLPWGLTQTHGGPCGVMAAIQAELLRILLFSPSSGQLTYPDELCEDRFDTKVAAAMTSGIDRQRIRKALSMAMAIILARASLMPSVKTGEEQDQEAKIVLPVNYQSDGFSGLVWDDLEPWSGAGSSIKSDKFAVHKISLATDATAKRPRTSGMSSSSLPVPPQERVVSLAHSIANFLQQPHVLDCFTKPGGVVLLVMSLVASRGASTIIQDMDDDTSKLTSQFGHCSQELINLLLTGQAVSNVFDNVMTPSGALTCYGIQRRPAVGYLTQLESLRYCEVGGYYKNPCFPIWVVGSTSHFTVLFGDASCLKESKSDALLEKCRRAFKEVDGEDNGFVSRMDLHRVYEILELDIGGEHAIQTLAATLEVSGADIILWDDFWKATSRLMTGASLESVLQGDDDLPPLRQITEHGEGAAMPSLANPETDEEMAKRLAAEWGSAPSAAATPPVSPFSEYDEHLPVQTAGLSDEEYARKLQAQFDSWGAGDDAASQGAIAADDLTTATLEEDEKMSDAIVVAAPAPPHVVDLTGGTFTTTTSRSPEFETFGETFSLYHYNGLRGGILTPFRVTRLTAEEAVGASIAMNATGRPGGAALGGDLEDVVRTKWPSCMINWLGKSPPCID